MKFNIAHIVSSQRLHGLYGYAEVIESVRWGLEQLGHEVAVRVNQVPLDCASIIFGFQMLDAAAIRSLPDGCIIYNLEQIAGLPVEVVGPRASAAIERMIIWDYSQRNIAVWRKLSPRHPPVHVPIGWAPTLERVASGVDKNIDVLFYGMPSNTRLQLIGDLAAAGHKTVFACGLYGAARDDLIARSKIVLNINLYDQSRVFEIVRVSYLLGNGKAVVSDVYPESDIDADIREAVAFAPLEQIIPTCARLLEDESARSRLEVLGSRAMQGRDIRAILRNALSQSGIQ